MKCPIGAFLPPNYVMDRSPIVYVTCMPPYRSPWNIDYIVYLGYNRAKLYIDLISGISRSLALNIERKMQRLNQCRVKLGSIIA